MVHAHHLEDVVNHQYVLEEGEAAEHHLDQENVDGAHREGRQHQIQSTQPGSGAAPWVGERVVVSVVGPLVHPSPAMLTVVHTIVHTVGKDEGELHLDGNHPQRISVGEVESRQPDHAADGDREGPADSVEQVVPEIVAITVIEADTDVILRLVGLGVGLPGPQLVALVGAKPYGCGEDVAVCQEVHHRADCEVFHHRDDVGGDRERQPVQEGVGVDPLGCERPQVHGGEGDRESVRQQNLEAVLHHVEERVQPKPQQEAVRPRVAAELGILAWLRHARRLVSWAVIDVCGSASAVPTGEVAANHGVAQELGDVHGD
mmetsp:Transcript_23587/g.58316  ORF Transcript_23587/g.58316 Transcript_23587/m.58316 type:complete len:317 (+) Transcript_23587:407-1357(+)